MGLFAKHNLPVLTASLDKAGLRRYMASKNIDAPWSPHFPHEAAFQFCAMRIESWFLTNARHERGLCIADETKAKPHLKSNMQMYRAGVPITLKGEEHLLRFDHLIDTIYFGDSHESVMLQLADACAFFVKRFVMGKADARQFFEIIAPQLEREPYIMFSKSDES